jgi:hypothetical protein
MNKSKFDEIVEDYGLEQAMRSRRASLVREYEQDKDFRCFGLKWQRAIESHDFEAGWLTSHGSCRVYGYDYNA